MSTNVSNVTSHFPKPQPGFTTTTSGSVSSGATTVGLNSTGNYSDGDIVVLTIDPADSDKKQVFVGTIDTAGVQVTGVVWTDGTNQSHASGATVTDLVAATHIQMMTKGMLVQHKQDGTHADTITTNTINENTSANGVTVDGLNIKDGKLNTSNSVVIANITDKAATSEKLGATVGFHATTTQSISNGAADDIVTYTEVTDYGSDFASGVFTAPYDGLYHFDVVMGFTDVAAEGRIDVTLIHEAASVARGHGNGNNNTNSDPTANLSLNIAMAAGETMKVNVSNNTGGAEALTQSSFSGYLVGRV